MIILTIPVLAITFTMLFIMTISAIFMVAVFVVYIIIFIGVIIISIPLYLYDGFSPF